MRKIHRQHRVAGIEEGEIARLVHRRAGKRLDVGVFGAEERAGAVAREVLDAVGEFLPAVIAPARIAFRVFVGQHRTERRQHFGIGVVLRRDHLDAVVLATFLAGDGVCDVGIEGLKLRRCASMGVSLLEDEPTF